MIQKTKTSRLAALVLVAGVAAASAVHADFEQAMDYFKSNKWLEAAGEFQVLVDESPEYADGYFMLGVCFMRTQKPVEAEKNFLKAIDLDGDKFVYHYNLANSYQVRKQYVKVVSTLNNAEALATDAHKLNIHKLRGFAQAAQKKWAEAIEDLEAANAIKQEAATQTQLGKAYFSLGDYESAVMWLSDSVKLEPNRVDGHELLAEGMINLAAKSTSESQKKSRYQSALSHADKFLKLEPNSSGAQYLVGRASLGTGDYDRAIGSFTKVLKSKPGNCNAMANLGKAYTAKKDWKNAEAALENTTSCDSSMAVAWENLGFVRQKMASETKSVDLYNQAIECYGKAKSIKPSGSIDSAISACQENINVIQHNQQMSAGEQEQQRVIAAEKARLEEEERKRREWEAKQDDD